jgi:4-amino-4-deoxy-L-arabinose transferase-like glycosyltransferase
MIVTALRNVISTRRGRVWGALAAITIFAALVRYWQITTLPPGYWYDEAHKSLVALEIARGLQAPIYVTDNTGLEAGYFWLLALIFKIFGPSYYGTRALSAFLGALTVPLTYWSIRTLYHPNSNSNPDLIALASAGLLSFLLWHVHWSRLGLETISVPLFAIALLGLMAWAWEKGSWPAFTLAGVVLGLSQYTNPGARVLPLQALLVFLILGLKRERPIKPLLQFGLAFLLAALLVYAPLGLFFLQNPQWFFARLTFTSANARAGGLPFYFDNVLKTLLSFNFSGDRLQRHNLAGRPAFDLIASLWMWAGIAVMIPDRQRWRPHLAIIAALIVNLIPMIFSDGAPGFGRTLGATPMLVTLPAAGVAAAIERGRTRRWPLLLIAASLVASAVINLSDYFLRYPIQPRLFDMFEVGLATLTRTAAGAAASGPSYLILDEATMQHPTLRLTRELTRGDLRIVNAEAGCFAYPAQTRTETIFAAQTQWLPLIQAQYPHAVQSDIIHIPEPYPYAAILTVPGGQTSLAGFLPAIAKFGDSIELLSFETASDLLPAESLLPLSIRLRWRTRSEITTRYTVFVHLVGEGLPFLGGVDGEPCAGWYPTDGWHADEVVEHTMTFSLPAALAPGSYEFAVGLYEQRTGQRLPVSPISGRELDRAFVKTLVIK